MTATQCAKKKGTNACLIARNRLCLSYSKTPKWGLRPRVRKKPSSLLNLFGTEGGGEAKINLVVGGFVVARRYAHLWLSNCGDDNKPCDSHHPQTSTTLLHEKERERDLASYISSSNQNPCFV